MIGNPHEKFECDRCGETFCVREATESAWGDAACPGCGSVRIGRVITRFQRLFTFLITYEQY